MFWAVWLIVETARCALLNVKCGMWDVGWKNVEIVEDVKIVETAMPR